MKIDHFNKGRKRSEETKRKISESIKEKYKDPTFRKKQFDKTPKGETHGMYGKESAFKGNHHTEESKQKSRKSQLGENSYWHGKTQNKISNKKRSETLKNRYENQPHFNKGKPLSEEHRLKISIANKGENSYCWKGGISSQGYCQVWSDEEFKREIKERDGNKCLNPVCNSKNSNDLVGHHIDYNKKNCNPLNIITVCRSCNAKANFDREWHRSWYEAIIYNKYVRRL